MKLTESLLALAKKVVRGAVGVGIEEAGARICGPTAWKYVKAAMTPVVKELEHRFPKIFLVPEEAEKAAEALSADKAFEAMLNQGFLDLQDGQQEILALLARQNETLATIGKNVDDGFAQLGKKIDNLQTVTEYIAAKLNEMNIDVTAFAKPMDLGLKPAASQLSTHQIYNQAFHLQADAQRLVASGEAAAASERLASGRALVETGLKHYSGNSDLLVSLGYIEKTEAQAALIQNHYEEFEQRLEKAAKCFAAVLSLNPYNAGALNGMANVYFYHHDYNRAIELGSLAADSAPDYAAAFWDLALSLEAKVGESGPDPSAIKKLKTTYRHLEALMPQQPEVFSASELAYVQKRLKALRRA